MGSFEISEGKKKRKKVTNLNACRRSNNWDWCSHGGWVTPALQVEIISVKELHNGRTSQQGAGCTIVENGRN
jgi:hypothetical protein